MGFQYLLICLLAIATNIAPTLGYPAKSLLELEYREYPRRTIEEAAVLEWGYSAIISALDASVAHFGPQTSQAALLEVECQPILARPLNGIVGGKKPSEGNDDEQEEASTPPVTVLDNADDVHGNIVVMTNTGNLSGITMAKIAKASGAAALLVVNIDEKRPDDIYRLKVEEGEEEEAQNIDIPVVMISLNSANVLTSATVTPEMDPKDVVNHGMPERVRLYAGGDRPFFEDVEPFEPTLYLIHNLLTDQECDDLVKEAKDKLQPVTKNNALLLTEDQDKLHKVSRTLLWKGALQSYAGKQIDERMEQVTGFPPAHYSDFQIDKMGRNSLSQPKFDTLPDMVPMATITIFLTEEGNPVVYPSVKNDAVKILPRKGMAIVHHNTNEKHELDMATMYAMLTSSPETKGDVYVARKFVFTTPVSNSRRLVLPLVATLCGGRLPEVVVRVHDFFVEKFGVPQGGAYFDKFCVFLPLLVVLGLAQVITDWFLNKDKKKEKKGKKD